MYAEVSTSMKQRKLEVFRSNRKRQSLETGSYTVAASSENAHFQWLQRCITTVKEAGFLEMLYQDVFTSVGEKRSPTYYINKFKKII